MRSADGPSAGRWRGARFLPPHPFAWLAPARQPIVLALAAVLTGLLLAAMHVTNAPLQTPVAPLGMISLQLAGELSQTERILAAWGDTGRHWAVLNLGIDCLYLGTYAVTIGLGCVLLSRQFGNRRLAALTGNGLAWGIVAAAVLDVVENVALYRLLLGDLQQSWAGLAFWCAVPKFGLVLMALLYLLIGGLLVLAGRFGRGRRHPRRLR